MQGKLAISVITRAEVLTGFEGKERQLAKRLLDRLPDHSGRLSRVSNIWQVARRLAPGASMRLRVSRQVCIMLIPAGILSPDL